MEEWGGPLMWGISNARLECLRSQYAPGTKGTVVCVDDIGTIHVHWDNGSSLGVAYGEDRCRVIAV